MQQQGSKYFARRHPYPMRMGSIGQKSTFTEHGHVAYQIRGMTEYCSIMVIYIMPADLPSPTDPRGLGQKSTFSEHGHVAYQIKRNHECSNMVPNILPTDPHTALTLRLGSKG